MKKNILLLLIVAGTIGLTYGLIHYIGVRGFMFAWVLNLMLMMCVLAFTETFKSDLNSDYYHEKKWEKSGKFYKWIGINWFRKLLLWVGWEKLNKKSNPVKKDLTALVHLYYRTKQSELGHSIIFFIVLGFSAFVGWKFGIKESLWLLTLNIILNLYPIFLQRYNRPRFKKAIRLYESRLGALQ